MAKKKDDAPVIAHDAASALYRDPSGKTLGGGPGSEGHLHMATVQREAEKTVAGAPK